MLGHNLSIQTRCFQGFGYCMVPVQDRHIWNSQMFWWYWCFPFDSSVEFSAYTNRRWWVILLNSLVYISPHTKMLRAYFVELKIIKHLNYPDWLKMFLGCLKHCQHARFLYFLIYFFSSGSIHCMSEVGLSGCRFADVNAPGLSLRWFETRVGIFLWCCLSTNRSNIS